MRERRKWLRGSKMTRAVHLAWHNSASDTPHTVLYYAHDGNKNVSEVIAANCDLAAHYDYAPFGAVISQRGTLSL